VVLDQEVFDSHCETQAQVRETERESNRQLRRPVQDVALRCPIVTRAASTLVPVATGRRG
jgi:hypothetical protein